MQRIIIGLILLLQLVYGFEKNRFGCPIGRAGPPECLEPYYLSPGEARPPGSLLLNMLIKNEAEHLSRTLPLWAKVIDYWIIGVDDANTDNSPEIIQKYLGHLPGEIVTVHFDGMGPTWSILVNVSVYEYPQATHGVLADADFAPVYDHFDRMDLDIRCSKHMYTIWTSDMRNERKMDWIYRNIPGAVVKRRTHQTLEVPELDPQEVFQTLVSLDLTEQPGGYQDRTGTKNERYIGFLEADLLDYPGDTRTLYYLGYGHYDIFANNANSDNLTPEHWEHLAKGVEYFEKRASMVDEGNKEELYFTIMKLGEINERHYKNWPKAESYYKRCIELDEERADSWFYIGQHYRLVNEPQIGLPYLYKAATLTMPERSLFQWHFLYDCLSKLEYGKALLATNTKHTKEVLLKAKKVLTSAICTEGDPGNMASLESMVKQIHKLLAATSKVPANMNSKSFPIKKVITFLVKNKQVIEPKLDSVIVEKNEFIDINYDDDEDEETDGEWDFDTNSVKSRESVKLRQSLYVLMKDNVMKMQEFNKIVKDVKEDHYMSTCRNYRLATTPYLRFFEEYHKDIKQLVSKSIMNKWKDVNDLLHATCRS